MNKYTAEQVESLAQGLEKYGLGGTTKGASSSIIYTDAPTMLREYAALLRERESAKAAVTDEMVKKAYDIIVTHLAGFGGPLLEGTRAALEAVAPMLANARVPEGWQLVPVEPTVEMMRAGDDTGFHTYTGTWSITPDACWQAMLAVAPKPETEE